MKYKKRKQEKKCLNVFLVSTFCLVNLIGCTGGYSNLTEIGRIVDVPDETEVFISTQ